ncbi:serine hydrolase domain-containing protein [Taibaiella helva]|uniref:serine hydrolase domain-containing protein n=1 Tax=Taibaiella helva TaxID=2301235 RepID=UPI000E5901B6|nr:serine hydrolase domain-containing protein [Taibaiella helva]
MKKTHRPIIAIAATLLLHSLSYAQSFNQAKMDSLFSALESKDKAMGSICIRQNGKEIYRRSMGYSFADLQKKAGASTKYRIGSITKMFTATMVLQLAEEKKIDLAAPLARYFSRVPNAAKITIRQMLQHHSGIHNFTDDEAYQGYMQQTKSEAEMLDIIVKGGSDFEPGTKGAYSNANYVLLGYIVEKVTKKPYAKALQERVCSKAGLKNTYMGGKAEAAKDESRSYEYRNGWQLMPETDMSIPGGAGGIVSTPGDLGLFIEALFAGKLISIASLELMKTMQDDYGLGMFVFPFDDKRAYGHNGGIDGFSSLLGYIPADKLAFAYCGNGSSSFSTNDIAIGALSILYNKPYVIPAFNTITVSTEQLDRYTGTYSSKQLPLKITISKEGATLVAQATGQSAFPLEATATDQFRFDAAGIVLEFKPDQKEMTLKQGGGTFLFTRE